MRTHESLIQELRALLPEYMAQKRIVVGGRRNRLIRCINPDHRDSTPSMSYHQKTQRLHCFGCGKSYDIFELIAMDYPECDSFPRQIKKACEIFGIPFPEGFGRTDPASEKTVQVRRGSPEKKAPEPVPAADYTGMVEEAVAACGTGGSYFAARGIPAELCARYRLFERDGRAYLPLFESGKCTAYCARAIRDGVQPRYKNSTGSMGLFGVDYLKGEGQGGELFVTEAVFDALSIEACGRHAVALCGAGNVRRFLNLCAENPGAANSYRFVAAGDRDAAGQRMNRELREGLEGLGLSCGELMLPGTVKDVNELLVADRAALEELLMQAADADRLAYAHTSAADAVSELLDASIRLGSRQAEPTGFRALDQLLDGGFYAGLYVLGAISSLGKTSYLLQIAEYIAANGTDVLFFSLEMGRLELVAKGISRTTWRLDPSAAREDAFTARQVLRMQNQLPAGRALLLNRAIEAYRKSAGCLFVREGIAEIGAQEVREEVRQHLRLRGKRPVVMVDYLQILKPADPRASDKQNTDRAVVELKRISRDFDLPVVAISSFNRENYRSAVSMEAFKESGAVEYSSDVLLGLQLAGAGEQGFDVNAAKTRNPRQVELVLLKNRNGSPYGRIPYAYHAAYGYFSELRSSFRP